MSNRNGHEDLFLMLLAAALAIAGIGYVFVLFLPYLIFYVLPFVAASLVVGGVLRMATLQGEDGLYNYRGLRVAYPALILLVAVVFFADSQRAVVVDADGNVTATYLEWPAADKTFNAARSSAYKNSFFKSLNESARHSIEYDRQEIGWIAILSLVLGGPLFFFLLGIEDADKDKAVLGKRLLESTRKERNNLIEKTKGLDETIAQSQLVLKAQVATLKRDKEALLEEIQAWQARAEFSDVPRPSESSKAGGVLDSDIL